METILCFGDSNTWGYIPGSGSGRFPFPMRIAGVLQAKLGPGCRVIEEGLCARMSAWDDPLTEDRNGKRQLPVLLESHRPLDGVIIMLGTNDLKRYMGLGPHDCAMAQSALIDIIEAAHCGPGGSRPVILLIAPPLVVETLTPFGNTFDGAIEKSLGMAKAYREVADQRGCLFLNAGEIAKTSVQDGIHLEAEAHARIGAAMAEILQSVRRIR
jgi:lysophospholipase L1-like esterase